MKHMTCQLHDLGSAVSMLSYIDGQKLSPFFENYPIFEKLSLSIVHPKMTHAMYPWQLHVGFDLKWDNLVLLPATYMGQLFSQNFHLISNAVPCYKKYFSHFHLIAVGICYSRSPRARSRHARYRQRSPHTHTHVPITTTRARKKSKQTTN